MGSRALTGSKALSGACFAFVVALLVPVSVSAQSAIAGSVKDTTGAVLPGVTVEASSPVLIERLRTAVTDAAGEYKIIDLRPGTYTVTFSLPGFAGVRREGIELPTSFTATVSAELHVGEVAETITVSGASPVVDLQNVTQHSVLARNLIDNLPTGKMYFNLAALVPGMVLSPMVGTSPYDVGGSAGEGSLLFSIHGGRTNDMILQIDGLQYGQSYGSGSASIGGFDAGAQEVNIETGSLSAEWSTGGVRVNMIPKEGGSVFHGGFYANLADHSFQSSNLSSTLTDQGIRALDRIDRIWDTHPEVGGPIKRDKLWFYAHGRYWGANKFVADTYHTKTLNSLVYDPDLSQPGIVFTHQSSVNLRLTWQASEKNKISVYGDRQTRVYDQVVGAGTTPEAWHHQIQPVGYLTQAKWTSPLTNRLLIESGLTFYYAHYINVLQPGVTPAAYAVTDSALGRTYNASPTYIEGHWALPFPKATLSYVTGSHALKTGFTLVNSHVDSWTTATNDLNLTVLNGVPISVTQRATPLHLKSALNADLGLFVQDQWTLRRLTLNLGLRFDYLNGAIPAQAIRSDDVGRMGAETVGRFVPPLRTFAAVSDTPNLKDLSPRIGVAYSLFGGKTAVKASVARYVGAPSGPSSPGTYNPISNLVTSATRAWTDLNNNGLPDCNFSVPGEDNECKQLSNPNFGLSVVNTRYDDAVRTGWFHRSFNWETSAGIQHQLLTGVSANLQFFRRSYGNLTVTDNVLAAPSDYDTYCIPAPSDARLPGGGGQQICGLYDINPLKFGQVSNFVTFASNYGHQYERWSGIDFTMSARLPKGAIVQGGLSTGKTVTDNCDVVTKLDNPSTRSPFCHVDTGFLPQYKFLGSYMFPWDIQVSGTLQSLAGPPITATYPAGTALIALSLNRNLSGGVKTANVELIAPGTAYGDRMYQVDFRVSKAFKHGGTRIQPEFNVYNLLNADPVVRINTAFGPQWLRPQGVLLGRFAKIGASIRF